MQISLYFLALQIMLVIFLVSAAKLYSSGFKLPSVLIGFSSALSLIFQIGQAVFPNQVSVYDPDVTVVQISMSFWQIGSSYIDPIAMLLISVGVLCLAFKVKI